MCEVKNVRFPDHAVGLLYSTCVGLCDNSLCFLWLADFQPRSFPALGRCRYFFGGVVHVGNDFAVEYHIMIPEFHDNWQHLTAILYSIKQWHVFLLLNMVMFFWSRVCQGKSWDSSKSNGSRRPGKVFGNIEELWFLCTILYILFQISQIWIDFDIMSIQIYPGPSQKFVEKLSHNSFSWSGSSVETMGPRQRRVSSMRPWQFPVSFPRRNGTFCRSFGAAGRHYLTLEKHGKTTGHVFNLMGNYRDMMLWLAYSM